MVSLKKLGRQSASRGRDGITAFSMTSAWWLLLGSGML